MPSALFANGVEAGLDLPAGCALDAERPAHHGRGLPDPFLADQEIDRPPGALVDKAQHLVQEPSPRGLGARAGQALGRRVEIGDPPGAVGRHDRVAKAFEAEPKPVPRLGFRLSRHGVVPAAA